MIWCQILWWLLKAQLYSTITFSFNKIYLWYTNGFQSEQLVKFGLTNFLWSRVTLLLFRAFDCLTSVAVAISLLCSILYYRQDRYYGTHSIFMLPTFWLYHYFMTWLFRSCKQRLLNMKPERWLSLKGSHNQRPETSYLLFW